MVANMLSFIMATKKIGKMLLSLIATASSKMWNKIISLSPQSQYLDSKEEQMGRKRKQQLEELRMSQAIEGLEEQQVENKFDKSNVGLAYSIIERNGKYSVVSVEFDRVNLTSGNVTEIESNTDRFLMQNRLQILLMGDDIL
jgi:hypothetical protein